MPRRTPPHDPRPADPLRALRYEADRTFTGWVPAEGSGPLHVNRLRKLERLGLVEMATEAAPVRDEQYPRRTRPGSHRYTVARPVGWRRPTDEEALRRLHLIRICARQPSPETLERCAGRPPADEGPDSDAAHAIVADGRSQDERDQLEAIRLAAGAQYDTAGQLIE